MTTYNSLPGNGYVLRIVIEQLSQNIANNTSSVRTRLYIVTPSHTYFQARATGKLVVNGTTVWSISGTTVNTYANNTAYLLKDDTRTITHNSDGTKTVPVSADFKTDTQGYSWSVPYLAVSGNFALTRIPRGPRVRHNGVWRNTVAYVRVAGVWKIAVPYVRSGGVWKIGGG